MTKKPRGAKKASNFLSDERIAELRAQADALYDEECTAKKGRYPDFVPETRILGSCKKCRRVLIEYLDPTGIWCYNSRMPEIHQVCFSGAHYYCRTCASEGIKKKHDRTF
jgi:hypothetical protein